jgi:hypothetical protein
MVELIVSALMWALVIVLILFRRARKERSVLYAAITIAITMMLNDDQLYVVVDGWFGGRDIVHLLSALTLMVGVYYLAQGISRASEEPYISGLPARIALWAALTITTVAFFLVPHLGETTESFMRVYGDHPAAAVYASTQYLYFIYVFSVLAHFALQTAREGRLVREKVAGALLLAGSVCTIALSITAIGMNLTHLIGGAGAAELWRPWYYLLQVGTFLFLTAGLATAPIVRWVGESRRRREIERQLATLEPLWRQATAARPSPQLAGADADPEDRLHRRIVEIRDAAMDRRNGFDLTDDDRRLLADAEQRLVADSR